MNVRNATPIVWHSSYMFSMIWNKTVIANVACNWAADTDINFICLEKTWRQQIQTLVVCRQVCVFVSLVRPPLNMEHGWVITSHTIYWIWLLFRALTSLLAKWALIWKPKLDEWSYLIGRYTKVPCYGFCTEIRLPCVCLARSVVHFLGYFSGKSSYNWTYWTGIFHCKISLEDTCS